MEERKTQIDIFYLSNVKKIKWSDKDSEPLEDLHFNSVTETLTVVIYTKHV